MASASCWRSSAPRWSIGALRNWPDDWWWISAGLFAAATIGLAQLAPVVLLPIFYKFKPLDRPSLVERLVKLAAGARTSVNGVFEWVLSSHTKKANAALAGLGRTRRILLSDTLLADYSEDEIEVILAHELAHHVHRDLWRGIAVQAVGAVGGVLRGQLCCWPHWRIRWGCGGSPIPPGCRRCC